MPFIRNSIVVVTFSIIIYFFLKRFVLECCTDDWIPTKFSEGNTNFILIFATSILVLKKDVTKKLYGQHLAEQVVIKSIEIRMKEK